MTRELLQRCSDALNDAHESIGDWGSYASDYFQQKWKLDDDIKKFAPLIAEIETALAKPPIGDEK